MSGWRWAHLPPAAEGMSRAAAPATASTEPAIAMLKPDAWERGLADAILARLAAAGFVEEARREVELRAADVRRLFLHPLPSYVAHLQSRPVSVHLLRGPGGPETLYACKWAIRGEFGVTDRLRNLIHGADEGNEHHLLLGAFFPDLPAARFCGAADLDLRFAPSETPAAAAASLAELDRHSALAEVVVTLRPSQAALAAVVRRPRVRLRARIAWLIELADQPGTSFQIHPPADAGPSVLATARRWTVADLLSLASDGHGITLADLPVPAGAVARYAADLRAGARDIDEAVADYPLFATVADHRRAGVGSFTAYRPGLSLMEVELRCDLARVAGLAATGGSAGRSEPGRFSVSAHCAAALAATMPARRRNAA